MAAAEGKGEAVTLATEGPPSRGRSLGVPKEQPKGWAGLGLVSATATVIPEGPMAQGLTQGGGFWTRGPARR